MLKMLFESPATWLLIAKILYSLFPVPSYRLASARVERFARTPQTSCLSSEPTSVSVLWSSHNSASIRTWRICHSARNSLDQKGILIHTAGESSQEQRQVIFSEVAKFKETLKLTRQRKHFLHSQVGKENGLRLLLDAEIFDYTYHRHVSEGFKIAVEHHLNQVSTRNNCGFTFMGWLYYIPVKYYRISTSYLNVIYLGFWNCI